MNLYHISQEVNDDYDTFSDAVVVAESEEVAKTIHPKGVYRLPIPKDYTEGNDKESYQRFRAGRYWVFDLEQVTVRLIGTAAPGLKSGEVICASFHAG